jgi:hypothetical protein
MFVLPCSGVGVWRVGGDSLWCGERKRGGENTKKAFFAALSVRKETRKDTQTTQETKGDAWKKGEGCMRTCLRQCERRMGGGAKGP